MSVPSPDVPSLLALMAGLALALGHTAWLAPRLGPRAAWATATGLALASLLAAFVLPNGLAMLAPASAVLFGQLGRWLAARVRTAASMPAPRPAAMAAPVPAPPASALPSTLGRYRIDSELGRGSMGAVYQGRDPQIGRAVAIKTLALGREFGADQLVEARARFFRKAETAGRLQHPDIVTIFDAGETGELAWIAMELVRGENLETHTVPNRLLPVPQVLEVVARVAEALSYAHSQGVVHRDVKPSNVMVDLGSGLVKVMDFGVARLDDASRTRTGVVLGTPSFMSPEQMAGRRADGRSDLYSLGVMLYQLLTASLPFEGGSMAELMRRIVNEPAPDVRGLRPELPQALADVVALALEKRPEVRYADGKQLAQVLRAVAAAMQPAPPPEHASSEQFEKTVTFAREEPRHNSAT